MSYSEISVRDAFERRRDYRIVDVREAHEYHGPLGRVAGAEHLPLGEVEAGAGGLAGDRPLLLVCRSGGRSGMACEKLQALGVADVTNLVGGMIAWNEQGLPIEQTPVADLAELVQQIVAWTVQVTPHSHEAVGERHREHLASLSLEPGTRDAVAALIDLTESWLSEAAPPDLGLCVASFRRALAAL